MSEKALSSGAQQRPSLGRSAPPPKRSAEINVNLSNSQLYGDSDNFFSKFTDFTKQAVDTTTKYAGKAAQVAEGLVTTTADAVGIKTQVQAAGNIALKLATKGRNDATKAMSKARRFANRAFEYDEDDEVNCYDYDLLLSAAGAVEKQIPVLGSHSQTFNLPAHCALVWKARVKKLDISFSVREARDYSNGNNNNQEISYITIEPVQRYTADMPIQGRVFPCDRARTINLHFDNTHSALVGKCVVYWVAIGEHVSLADDIVGAARSKERNAADEGPPLD
jgi:hypothetical protein